MGERSGGNERKVRLIEDGKEREKGETNGRWEGEREGRD